MLEQTQSVTHDGESLDTRLLMLGVWRRRWFLAVCLVLSAVVGLAVGKFGGGKTWSSVVTFAYDAGAVRQAWNIEAPNTSTVVGMAQERTSLEAVRRRLKLDDVTLARLESAVLVAVDRESGNVKITTMWPTRKTAFDLAVATREVFRAKFRSRLLKLATDRVRTLQAKYRDAEGAFEAADGAQQKFLAQNRVTPDDLSATRSVATINQLDMSHRELMHQRKALEAQLASAGATLSMLEQRAGEERRQAQQSASASEAAARMQAMTALLAHDQTRKSTAADLQQADVEYQRAYQLREKGLLSQEEFEKAFTAHQKLKVAAADQPDTRQYRSLVEASLRTPRQPVMVPSESQAEATRDRLALLRVDMDVLDSKARQVAMERDQLLADQRRYPALERQYARLNSTLQQREKERTSAESDLFEARRLLAMNAQTLGADVAADGITMVADAEMPIRPAKSLGKVIAAMVAMFGFLVGLGFVLYHELTDKRIKSPAELPVKLELAVIGAVPKNDSRPQPRLTDDVDAALVDTFVPIARRLRQLLPRTGARILVASAHSGEGKSLVSTCLGMALARRQEQVLLVDAGVTSEEGFLQLVPEMAAARGLNEYLRGDAGRIDDVVWPTRTRGVDCLPLVDRAGGVDMIGTDRMRDLLHQVSGRYGMVLVEAPPLRDEVDCESLARACDGILFVVRNWTYDVPTLRRAIERLSGAGVPILGAVVTGVDPLYLERN